MSTDIVATCVTALFTSDRGDGPQLTALYRGQLSEEQANAVVKRDFGQLLARNDLMGGLDIEYVHESSLETFTDGMGLELRNP